VYRTLGRPTGKQRLHIRELRAVSHCKLGKKHPIDVALEQSRRAPPPIWRDHDKMFAPSNELLLLRDVGFKRFHTMKTAAQHEIKLKISQRDAADLVPPFACTVEVRRSNSITETAFVRMSVQKKDAHTARSLNWCRLTPR